MNRDLDGKVVVVTGASTGLGRAPSNDSLRRCSWLSMIRLSCGQRLKRLLVHDGFWRQSMRPGITCLYQ